MTTNDYKDSDKKAVYKKTCGNCMIKQSLIHNNSGEDSKDFHKRQNCKSTVGVCLCIKGKLQTTGYTADAK